MCEICDNLTKYNSKNIFEMPFSILRMTYHFPSDKFYLKLDEYDNDEDYINTEATEIFYCPFCGRKLSDLLKQGEVVDGNNI